jgi:hypothetical protein
MDVDLLDLREYPLPFFDEKGPIMRVSTENAEALRWQTSLVDQHDDDSPRRLAPLKARCLKRLYVLRCIKHNASRAPPV